MRAIQRIGGRNRARLRRAGEGSVLVIVIVTFNRVARTLTTFARDS